MKIWSRTLTGNDFQAACKEANLDHPGIALSLVNAEKYEGPRTRRFDRVRVRAKRTGRPANTGNRGADRDDYFFGYAAPSWAEYGWWMARVFEKDPNARIKGAMDYRGADSFHAQTDGVFILPGTPRERQIKRELAIARQTNGPMLSSVDARGMDVEELRDVLKGYADYSRVRVLAFGRFYPLKRVDPNNGPVFVFDQDQPS